MKITHLALAALTLATTFTTPLAFAKGDLWMSDFSAAKKKAAAEHKDLLVDFTGSDWCGWCIKLNNEVFKHDSFLKGVADHFVLVEIDFPQDKSKLSDATKKQNETLQKTYQVQGFPTILLMDEQGRPYAKTGYRPGGPEAYLKHLTELRAHHTKLKTALSEAEKLTGVDKAKALIKALALIPAEYLSHYSDITDQITKLDPKDETGFVKEQQYQADFAKLMGTLRTQNPTEALKSIDTFIAEKKPSEENKKQLLNIKFQIKVSELVQQNKTDEALKLVDTYISENNLTGADKQGVTGTKIGILLRAKKFDAAEKTLDEIIAIDPKTELAKEAESFKPRLKQMKAQAAKEAKKP